MNIKNTQISTVIFSFFMLTSSMATASVILSPTAVVGNTLGTWVNGGSTTNIINQTGLSSGFVSGVTDFSAYLATDPIHATNDEDNAWSGENGPVLGNLDFDLGDTFLLSSLVLWSQSNANGIDGFTVFSSLDATFSSTINLGTFSASIPAPIRAQTFVTPSTAQFIRLQVNSTHDGGNFVNIGEIAFEVSAVPIPATAWLFGSGLLSLVGMAGRKKMGSPYRIGDNSKRNFNV
jgi:hypothetical protein